MARSIEDRSRDRADPPSEQCGLAAEESSAASDHPLKRSGMVVLAYLHPSVCSVVVA